MTDRELLEKAAMAMGEKAPPRFYPDGSAVLLSGARWNPLTDDGDAFRLQVRRRFHVCIFSATEGDIETPGFVEVWQEDDADPLHVEYVDGGDYEKATRRAIVRAAAALGEAA